MVPLTIFAWQLRHKIKKRCAIYLLDSVDKQILVISHAVDYALNVVKHVWTILALSYAHLCICPELTINSTKQLYIGTH